MKKASVIFSLFFFYFALGIEVKADDGGPNTDFWVKDNKVVCLSVANPEDINNDSFLLFDYSKTIGQSLGKPWAIVEKGKCYQIEGDDQLRSIKGTLYQIKIVRGDEKEYYANYKNFSPTSDVKTDKNIIPVTWIHEDIGISYNDELHFTGIQSGNILLTKYKLGSPITSFSSGDYQHYGKILEDKIYTDINTEYLLFARDLENTIRSCDNRKRIEYQIRIDPKYTEYQPVSVIWKLKDDTNLKVGDDNYFIRHKDTLDSLKIVELIGCQQSYKNFINSHNTDFLKFDEDVKKFITKYPELYSEVPDSVYLANTVINRSQIEIDLIRNFIDKDYLPTSTNTPTPRPTITHKITSVVTPTIIFTQLDEPTSERKAAIIRETSPFLKIYFLLPFLVLAGSITFFVIKRIRK